MSRWQDNFPWTASAIGFLWPSGPARRKRWLKIALTLAVLVAAHAALTAVMAVRTARVADRFVERWGPLDVTMYRPASVDDAMNQARAVRAATEMMVLPPVRIGGDARIHESFASGPEREFTATDRDAIRNIVADNALALSILDVATARAGSDWSLHYERGIEMDVPPLLRIMQLAKLNAAAGRLALEDGHVDEALAALRRGNAIASSLAGESVLIVQLIRLAVERIDAQLVRRILGSADLDPERMTALRSALPDADARPAIQLAMVAETKALVELFRSGTGASGYASSGPSIQRVISLAIVRVVVRPYLLGQERLWLEIMSSRIEELDAPRHARGTASPGPTLRPWDALVGIVLMNVGGLIERSDLAETREQLCRTAIAIESRRIETGRAPATLAELVPAYLSSVPLDPWTGRAFRYETDGAGWRLRSEADVTSVESARIADPVLDWSRPLTAK